jgi:dTMP kinase
MNRNHTADISLRIPAPHPPRRGLLISFEGGDGAGKTTQIRMLRTHLIDERSVSEDLVLSTFEPGATPLGEGLREAVLHDESVGPRTEALLYATDRAHHIESVIRPHLARGGLVLTDRYVDSSIAYQGAGRSLEGDQIAALSLWATDGLMPDRTILLDMPPESLGHRKGDTPLDKLESEGQEFHTAVREKYLELAQAAPDRFAVIDATRSRDEVHADVLAAVAEDLARFDPTFDPEATEHERHVE